MQWTVLENSHEPSSPYRWSRAGLIHNQDKKRIVPPNSEVCRSAGFFFPIPGVEFRGEAGEWDCPVVLTQYPGLQVQRYTFL